jgi:hypothetical protein
MATTDAPRPDPHANIVFIVPDPLDLPADDDSPATGCVWGLLFSAACWLIFGIGLLAFAGILRFS